MRVTIKFTDSFSREFKVESAKELIAIHKKVLKFTQKGITEEQEQRFASLLEQLDNAKAGQLIEFSILKDIHFEGNEHHDNFN